MKILITGASGLLGSNLSQEFQSRNVSCITPSHSEFNIINYEQLDSLIKNNIPDIIVHCAAIAKFADVEKDPILALDTNIIGTTNIVKLCINYTTLSPQVQVKKLFDNKNIVPY